MIIIGTCDTCKFYTPGILQEEDEKELFFDEVPQCNNEKLSEDIYGGIKEDELKYSYNEGGVFHPGPKFGCIHWSKNGTPNMVP